MKLLLHLRYRLCAYRFSSTKQEVVGCVMFVLLCFYPSSGKQRSHRSTETLPRGTASLFDSRNTIPVASRQRLHRSASRENRVPSWRGWIRLVKPNPGDSFGIGLSKGLSSRGIYVSAIRPGSIADISGLLQIYDRILKVQNLSSLFALTA